MANTNYIIYCDESLDKGEFYSNFYGGALINEAHLFRIEKTLNDKKTELNLYGEIKWVKITENYQDKYIDFINLFFDLIESDLIKIRIKFRQNRYVVTGLTIEQKDNEYFLLYYQLIKHAFGLEYSNLAESEQVFIKLFLDDIPDTPEKYEIFKGYIVSMSKYPIFKNKNIKFSYENIFSVSSHKHLILQGLDIIQGAIQFRLNNKHLLKAEGTTKRGKRTIAKEKVYQVISQRIRKIYPNFNIGNSTSTQSNDANRWLHSYRHWSFIPKNHILDNTKTK